MSERECDTLNPSQRRADAFTRPGAGRYARRIMNKPLLAIHDDYLLHEMGRHHPESPERLRAIYRHLRRTGLMDRSRVLSPEPLSRELIELNHPGEHIERVKRLSEQGGGALDPDTSANAETYRVALLAAGAVLQMVDEVWDDPSKGAGFALVRPPGHHAERERAMGFCFFNNVAIAAEHLLKNRGARRVAIVDPDLHHGNGTQDSFYSRKDVLYISTHQYPYYPGTGHFTEAGKGEGEGYTVNLPLPGGQGDGEYVYLTREFIAPLLRSFEPDFILVSAGFDTYEKDPLGGMNVTETGFAAMARLLIDAARETCQGKIVFALEGGYHVEGLARSVGAVVEQMIGETPVDVDQSPDNQILDYQKQLSRFFGQWWKAVRP